jgi:CRP-like cAMP-binding protein
MIMLSPELLKRYAFFAHFSDKQLQSIAELSAETSLNKGDVLFEECQPANFLFLLLEGGLDLSYKSEEEFYPKTRKDFDVGQINPGEVFALSSLIEPFALNATAHASKTSKLIKIDAVALRKLFDSDPQMGYIAMKQLTKAIMERLADTRVQLAAACA